MNIRQQYTVERIVIETYNKNKDKPFNEIKKMIKLRIELEISEEVASKVGTEKIIEIVNKSNNSKKENKGSKSYKPYCNKNKKGENHEL